MAIVSVVLARGFAGVLSSYWIGLFGVVAVGGVLLAISTCRRLEWASFRNAAGADALMIARAGPNRGEFESFVSAVVNAIQAVRGSR